MKDNTRLYYSSITEREGSWQRSDGYLLSDDKDCLQDKINSMPKHGADLSWEYSEIRSFKTTENGCTRFCKYAVEGILAIDDFELEKFKS